MFRRPPKVKSVVIAALGSILILTIELFDSQFATSYTTPGQEFLKYTSWFEIAIGPVVGGLAIGLGIRYLWRTAWSSRPASKALVVISMIAALLPLYFFLAVWLAIAALSTYKSNPF